MKKILLTFAALLGLSAAAFTLDLGDIKGSWIDSKWDAKWTFSGNGNITLSDSNTGKEIFVFTDSNVQNFKPSADASGASVYFECKATHRTYKFTKPLTLNADLNMEINPDWTTETYSTKIKFSK